MRPIFSFGKDIGIDLGTANTLVFMRGQGIILREPSVVAVDTRTDTVRYVGQEAKDVIGRTPGSIVAVRPLKDGVIADFDITANMLQIFIKKKYYLLIGERTAEEIKIKIGSAYPYEDEQPITIKGRNLADGLPKNIEIYPEEIREALADPLASVIDAIKGTLEKTPPELSADIIDNGIVLTGGGALLRGLDKLVERETGISVRVAENPLDCVALGTGMVLENLDELREVLDNDDSSL